MACEECVPAEPITVQIVAFQGNVDGYQRDMHVSILSCGAFLSMASASSTTSIAATAPSESSGGTAGVAACPLGGLHITTMSRLEARGGSCTPRIIFTHW